METREQSTDRPGSPAEGADVQGPTARGAAPRARWNARVGPLALGLAVLGLLLWAKLLLVTNHPRTAVAKPAPAPVRAPAGRATAAVHESPSAPAIDGD